VKIQVIAGEIRKRGRVEAESVHAAQRQTVAGYFHGGVGSAFAFQAGEDPQQVERFRRGVHGLHHAPKEVIFDGADERCLRACRPKDGIDKKACCGFAVGPGDSGEL
jgi:hypothetical protein